MTQRVPNRGYRISEAAAEAGFEPSTVRYYERIGLIPEPTRTEGGHRLYTSDDVERLKVIAGAKSLGLALEDIGRFLAQWERGACPPAREVLEQLIERSLDDTRHRIAELVEFHNALAEVFEDLQEQPAPTRCGAGCGCDVRIDRGPDHTSVHVVDPRGRVRLPDERGDR
ncbi:MAG: MerR family transcriptional regulator [Actinobacteria bacterium]|nr:MerR family transcriptional regulator [Actinomycetota bacterium]